MLAAGECKYRAVIDAGPFSLLHRFHALLD